MLLKSSIFVAAALIVPAPISSQVCGTFTEAAEHLARHVEVFVASEWSDERAAIGINAIGSSDPVLRVTSTATCTTLINKEVSMMGLPAAPDSNSYAIYRYGAYYAIEYRPPPRHNGSTVVSSSVRLRVYTVGQGIKLKGTINVLD